MAEIKIKEDQCKGCEICVVNCVKGLIILGNSVNVLGYHPVEFEDPGNLCTGCKLCAEVCPDCCIEVYK